MGYTRRELLKRGGITAGATALGVVALPSPIPEQRPERPVEAHDRVLPEIHTEEESPYALYHYSWEGDHFERTLPINVVVSLAGTSATFDDVLDVFREAGWLKLNAEYVRFAYNVLTDEYERQHATAVQSFFGGFGRHHIRAWEFDGRVSIQAHQDSAALPSHQIVSLQRSQHLLEWLFHEAGWTVKPDGAWFDNAGEPDHEGYVTVIEP